MAKSKVLLFPGQGSQKKGMGNTLFERYADFIDVADSVLGYSIKELCSKDPGNQLKFTQYTQPALYVVNALTYLEHMRTEEETIAFLAGHSLGQFNALFAANVFDFETGLKLVKRRGELMSQAALGSMAAVVGISGDVVTEVLKENGLSALDIANYNSHLQTVIAGPVEDIKNAAEIFKKTEAKYIPLNVSAPFHSRYMREASGEFLRYIEQFTFAEPSIPVICNVTAKPLDPISIKYALAQQIELPVRWTETIGYLLSMGDYDYIELGPGNVLTKLLTSIADGFDKTCWSYRDIKRDANQAVSINASDVDSVLFKSITAESLGSESFKNDYNLKYAYYAGAMYKGIASTELVIRMSAAGFMAFYGCGGQSLETIEKSIEYLQSKLNKNMPYGMNLLHNLANPQAELDVVDLFIRCGVRLVEASAFMGSTLSLVRFRLNGLKRDSNDKLQIQNSIIAKLSRPEIASVFLSPPPDAQVQQLLEMKLITAEEAELSRLIPLASDICIEADSGGHTDMGVASVLIPTIVRLRDKLTRQFGYERPVRVGAAGGIGDPNSAVAAFILGAEFISTGSINQCTVEAGTSNDVKDILQTIDVQDTAYAPAGDMFELGAKVQVVRKGLFFPSRANKLYELWKQYDSWEDIDVKIRKQIEEKYFKRSFDAVWTETSAHYEVNNPAEFIRAKRSPKHKMALVFRWYFVYSTRLAMAGSALSKVDYQIHCGPSLGAFNQWVAGTRFEKWQDRHVDEIGLHLMEGAAMLLQERLAIFITKGP